LNLAVDPSNGVTGDVHAHREQPRGLQLVDRGFFATGRLDDLREPQYAKGRGLGGDACRLAARDTGSAINVALVFAVRGFPKGGARDARAPCCDWVSVRRPGGVRGALKPQPPLDV
jgi:hypothetical protein